MEVRVETVDDIEVARVRHVGRYDKVSQCFRRAPSTTSPTANSPCATAAPEDSPPR